jgi:hypothetical protein
MSVIAGEAHGPRRSAAHQGGTMSYPMAAPGSYQIDVVDQVSRAYGVMFSNMQLIVEMALLPYLIVLASELIVLLVSGGFFGGLLAMLINAIALLIFGTVFIVRWHRFILVGERVSGGLIPPGWTPFVIVGLKLGVAVFVGWVVLAFLAAMPPHFLTAPLAVIGGIVLALVSLRVSLVFPAAAIERPVGFRTAWDWIAGNFWRLFVCALACYVPFIIAQIIVGWIAALFPSLFWIVFAALQLAISFVGGAVAAGLLSHLYREMIGTAA